MTSGGMVEATGAGFANTWKAQSSCHDKLDWLDDPCSLNIESGKGQGKLVGSSRTHNPDSTASEQLGLLMKT